MFLAALSHGTFSLVQFHALDDRNMLASLLSANTRFNSLSHFPFQLPGLLALLILFLMAATSHDFWLHSLGAGVWKRLHMLVYLAYGLLVAHVALGALQSETSPVLASVLAAGLLTVVTLHVLAGYREAVTDWARARAAADGFVEVGEFDSIAENRARILTVNGERVAVFRYDGRVAAISNVCRHQNGPLGEGRIVNGCVTCPWHGYQYAPDSGCSPPPYQDRVATFQTRIAGGTVFVHPHPHAPETRLEPAVKQ
jgi:nitrite reductase/ring-hydroxylating ferredoxin subunit